MRTTSWSWGGGERGLQALTKAKVLVPEVSLGERLEL